MQQLALPIRKSNSGSSKAVLSVGFEPWLTDVTMTSVALIFVAFSLVMIYSTTGVISREKFGDPFSMLKRQLAAACVGFVLMLICARIDVRRFEKWSRLFLVISVGLLLLTFIPGIGSTAGGAQRWVNLALSVFSRLSL